MVETVRVQTWFDDDIVTQAVFDNLRATRAALVQKLTLAPAEQAGTIGRLQGQIQMIDWMLAPETRADMIKHAVERLGAVRAKAT